MVANSLITPNLFSDCACDNAQIQQLVNKAQQLKNTIVNDEAKVTRLDPQGYNPIFIILGKILDSEKLHLDLLISNLNILNQAGATEDKIKNFEALTTIIENSIESSSRFLDQIHQ